MAETKRYISKEELKTHSRDGDLWISIQGKVYNVSDWAKVHPGGSAPLLSLAGQDATDAFVAYHPGVLWSRLDDFFTGFHLEDYAVSEASRDYRRLVYEFTKMGLFEKKGHGVFVTLCAMAVMFSACIYGVLGSDSTWVHLASGRVDGAFLDSEWVDWARFWALPGDDEQAFEPLCAGAEWELSCGDQYCVVEVESQRSSHCLQQPRFRSGSSAYACIRVLVFVVVQEEGSLQGSGDFGAACVLDLHVQFCLNHFSSSVYVGPPSGNDWFEKQTHGSLDISCSSWMDWFHGGLQFQIEHHLFPRLPRNQLRNVSPFVQELCKKHNLPYDCASFWKANVLTLATLRTAALQARDLANPIPKNLVWEAVNTHG
ncbi:Acyl-lipid (9-3)-desaturase [Vitis vinifera]|uniref:Acyl-lipid (9-3)-desaturase n=1 Tax=Vitis vinifera TaxID=29760 RepID=A0A438EXC2_VITVI|nr:Acyl-lipid (9-3)-desaturase [Vitis vinifera]